MVLVRVGFLEISGAIASSVQADLLNGLVRGLAGDLSAFVELKFQRQVPVFSFPLPNGLGSVRPVLH